MAKKQIYKTEPPKEKAFLVGAQLKNQETVYTMDESLAELEFLAETAGIETVGQTYQMLTKFNPKTMIGTGKLEEVTALAEEFDADLILFDDELSPRHQRELEKVLDGKFRLLDRTTLILDIFAQRASTHEGSLQVELAQYEYRLPRLTRAWTHLARQAGGGGGRSGGGGVGLRGPGEKQLEVDRRDIHRRIDQLKMELEKVRAHRGRHRAKRKQSRIPVVALVGYTNAGKSTLLNALASSDVYVADQLFATLDPTTRRVPLPGGRKGLFSDTVGFIQKLPTNLVAAFRATLEEIADAELLLHVVDITHENVMGQVEAVHQTLKEIEADHIPMITVLNKIDNLQNPDTVEEKLETFDNAVGISALKKVNLDGLVNRISQKLFEEFEAVSVHLPYSAGNLNALFHEQGQIDKIEHTKDGIFIEGSLPGRLMAMFSDYLK